MYKNLRFKTLLMLFSFWAFSVSAQEYSFEDFVGTWHGNISATNYGGFNDPMTMTIYEDGFYTESTGRLMPSTYPNTQQCEYQASTNRFHWWYLSIVYAGQNFYEHHYYSIVHFQNDTLIMHYNFHNNPEPWPDAGVIFLVKENTNATPPPVNLDLTQTDNLVYIAWDVPENGNQNPDSYNIYVSVEMNDFELLGITEETQFMVNETAAAGLNEYYVTAVYDTGESDPSESLYVLYETPEPINLLGEPQTGEIAIEWSAPDFGEVLPAALYGYNVYHKYEDGTYEVVQFTEDLNFVHENPVSGTHFYYVTAVYNGGESEPSNEIEVSYVISSLGQNLVSSARIYPNPASDFITIQAEENIYEISIFNQQGQLILQEESKLQQMRINISDLPAGLYTLKLKAEDRVILKKLIKN